MISKAKSLLLRLLLTVMLCGQSGCDTITDFIHSFDEGGETSQKSEEPAAESHAMISLLDILDRQKTLIEDIEFARSMEDKEAVKQSVEEILQLEQSYQDQFEQLEAELTAAEANEIAGIHREIIKNLPSFNSLMR